MPDSSVIGRSSVVRGNVRGDGNLEILGRIEGDVSVSGDIVLAETAGVRGSLNGASITVAGQVQGDIRGSEAVLVESGARVVGDLLAPRIGVAAGALVKGNVRTEGEAPLAGARRPATTGLRSPAFTQKPAPTKPSPEAPRAAAAASEPEAAEKPAAKEKKQDGERQAPPPVVPVLAKGAKAKKKKQRE